MDYYARLGRPETDPDRIALRQAQQECVRAVTARNESNPRQDQAAHAALVAQAQAAHAVRTEILNRIVARLYVPASTAEPVADEPESLIEEDED